MQRKAFFFVVSFFGLLDLPAQVNLPLIPRPAIVREKTGNFQLDATVQIVCDSSNLALATQWQHVVFQQTDLVLTIQTIENQLFNGKKIVLKSQHELEWQHEDMPVEGYFLKISKDSIVVDAPFRRGHFYALQTFRQLMGFERHRSVVSLPACDIVDAPAFDHRGVMFDVARHFIPLEVLKKQVELLAFYKINVIRLHLTDDQAWRIEIKKYPELVRKGAWRRNPDGKWHGGFYTADELRDFIRFCAQHHIEVIPEIEMPGHCRAALSAYPHLSCRGVPLSVPNVSGVFSDVFCAGNDAVYRFLEDVLDEVLTIFPAKIIHIGGREVPLHRWENCAKCRQRVQNEQLTGFDALHAYFISRIQQWVERRGRILAGDDAIRHGNISPTAIIQIGRSMDKTLEALRAGHSVVLSPESHCHLSLSPAELNLETLFHFDPLADPDLLAHAAQILGIEAIVWSENILANQLESWLFPRVLAHAELAWSGGGSHYDTFLTTLKQHEGMLDSLDVALGSTDDHLMHWQLRFLPATQNWTLYAKAGRPGIEFWYLPEYHEMKYFGFDLEKPHLTPALQFKDSLLIIKPLRLKFAPVRRGKPLREEIFIQILKNDALGCVPAIYPDADEQFYANGAASLTDGIVASNVMNTDHWLGWQGQDVTCVFDFRQFFPLKRVVVRLGEAPAIGVLLPKLVQFYTSDDGNSWSLMWLNEHRSQCEAEHAGIVTSVWEAPPQTTSRFLKIILQNAGALPEYHHAAGTPSWILSDEILIEN